MESDEEDLFIHTHQKSAEESVEENSRNNVELPQKRRTVDLRRTIQKVEPNEEQSVFSSLCSDVFSDLSMGYDAEKYSIKTDDQFSVFLKLKKDH